MHSRRNLLWGILVLVILVEGIVVMLRPESLNTLTTAISPPATTPAQFAHLNLSENNPATTSTTTPTPAAQTAAVADSTVVAPAKKETAQRETASPEVATAGQKVLASGGKVAARINNPYSFPPQTFATTDTQTRAALVNILCLSEGNSTIRPISGSGVIIDPRGVILTNAHVAQYVLLSEASGVNLSCSIRTGSPARAAWQATVLHMPMVWVREHVNDLNSNVTITGTGEHDYALLVIGAAEDSILPSQFPYLPIDTREAIGFLGDDVLIGGYPAEFIGGVAAQHSLYSLTSTASIRELLTFGPGSVDLIAFKGVIEAQSGSSGGPVVNPWGRLIGIITTTSDAATTDARDLRALTLSYIDRDIKTQTGSSLAGFLNGSLADKVTAFKAGDAQTMLNLYLARIEATQ